MRVAIVFVFLSISPMLSAQNVTNPCDDAMSQQQMNACADFEFKQADAHLNRVYQRLADYMRGDLVQARKDSDRDQMRYVQTGLDSLKEAERVWLSYRDIQCRAAAQEYEGGSMSPMIYSQCLKTLTDQRIEALKSIYGDGDRKLD